MKLISASGVIESRICAGVAFPSISAGAFVEAPPVISVTAS
jgi:hypothetical protein